MRKLFQTFIFLFSITVFHVKAQQTNTIITRQITETVCKGATISVPFTSTGAFENGNVFKVQVRTSNNTNAWTDLSTEGVSSPLKAIIPTNYSVN